MQYTREAVEKRLTDSFRSYYDIHIFEEKQRPLVARFDYFEHSEKFVLSRKAQLWEANGEEFLYLLSVPRLTKELFDTWRDFIHEDGMKQLHIGSGHMYSYITPVFICDSCDDEARRALKKCRIYKSFHFSLHGWMDFHAVAIDLERGRIDANRGGRETAKILKKILYS